MSWHHIRPLALATKPGLCMEKIGDSTNLKLACSSDVPFTLILQTMLKTQSSNTLEEVWSSMISWSSVKNRQQSYSDVFQRPSVKGAQRKVFHEVWRVPSIGSVQWKIASIWAVQNCLHSRYPSSKTFTPQFLRTKATPWISWLSRGLLRGSPRMSGSVSYAVAWYSSKLRALPLALDPTLTQQITCIRACQGFVVNVLFAKLQQTVRLSHTRASKIGIVSYLSHT